VTASEEFVWYAWVEERLMPYLRLALRPEQFFEGDTRPDMDDLDERQVFLTDDTRRSLVEAYGRHGETLGISEQGPRILWINTAGFTVFRRRQRRGRRLTDVSPS
jgi:hypothetical protein